MAEQPPWAGLRLEECEGLFGTFEVSRESVKDRVGDGFEIQGLTTVSATLAFEQLVCARAVVPYEVLENVTFLSFLARVVPTNSSQDATGPSLYALLLISDSQRAAAALSDIGIESLEARVERAVAPTSGEPRIQNWKYEAANMEISLEATSSGRHAGGGSLGASYWIPTAVGVNHFGVEKRYDIDQVPLMGGVIRILTTAPQAAPFGEAGHGWGGQYYPSIEESWSPVEEGSN